MNFINKYLCFTCDGETFSFAPATMRRCPRCGESTLEYNGNIAYDLASLSAQSEAERNEERGYAVRKS